ncbi:hypothetical protein Moror_1784 [Moniliophthora roreri MCA 2997]|uniref:Uncharacterized protein n=1 Tax=Moniliophthora roreri (strain MCA 2997) TaxID=1381753 RepID=V2X2N0_MONRO|nr:hypothetical protein Moror_1784 [Moniliophthora roreri MCA 2997]
MSFIKNIPQIYRFSPGDERWPTQYRRKFLRRSLLNSFRFFSLTEESASQRRQNTDSQTSFSLDPKIVTSVSSSSSSIFDASLISLNNFTNFCATVNLPITNGKQIISGSCNPAPMGLIGDTDHIPSVKFRFPLNRGTLEANQAFTVVLVVKNLNSGNFVNAKENYLAAPQQLDGEGAIIGYYGIVIERMNSLDETVPLDPLRPAFYNAASGKARNGQVTADVRGGLPKGFYRLSSVTLTSNHKPIVAPVIQHGAIGGVVYLTVTEDGNRAPRNTTLGPLISPASEGSTSINTTNLRVDIQDSISMTLDPVIIATGFSNDGQSEPTPGQAASLTPSNNFINFCLTRPDLPLTDGRQITTGSCSTTPLGVIPPQDLIPSHKFQIPRNGDSLYPNTPFIIKLNFHNMKQAITDPLTRYLSAPQQIDSGGRILGYSRIVVEAVDSIDQTTPTDPKKFAFSTALSTIAEDGSLMTNVTEGLPAGSYRLSSIALTANHQPILLPVAERGAVNDAVYFTVGDGASGLTVVNTVTAGPPSGTSTGGRTGTNDDSGRSSTKIDAIVGGVSGGFAMIAIVALLFFPSSTTAFKLFLGRGRIRVIQLGNLVGIITHSSTHNRGRIAHQQDDRHYNDHAVGRRSIRLY